MIKANPTDLQRKLAYQIAENRPLGLANTWQMLVKFAFNHEYAECQSLLAYIVSQAAPLSRQEEILIKRWQGLLFEHLGIDCHIIDCFWDARQFYLRSKNAFRDLQASGAVRRLGTLEWLLAGGKRDTRAKPVLQKYLDDAVKRIKGINTTQLLREYLGAENSDWKLRRSALAALADMGEWDVIRTMVDQLPLQGQRDALSMLFEMGIPMNCAWLADCIHNKNGDQDWYIRLMTVRFFKLAEKCEMNDEDWRVTTWDHHFLVRMELVHALRKWKPKLFDEYLIDMLHDNTIDVQMAVLQLMAEIKDPRFIEAVRTMNSSDHDLIGRSFELIRKSFLEKLIN